MSKKCKKIVFFNSSIGVGGVPRVICTWGNYFVKKKFKVEIISNIESKKVYDFDKKISFKNLKIDKFGTRNKHKIFIKLFDLLKNKRNELLIFNKDFYTNYLFIFKKLRLISKTNKLVYFVHGGTSDFKYLYSNFKKIIILNTYDEIIVLHDDYDTFISFKKKNFKRKILDYFFIDCWNKIKGKINLIPNPVPFRSDETSNLTSKLLIAAGRFDYIKGFDLLIKAWALIENKHTNYFLQIFGDGEQKENLITLINKLKLQNVKLNPTTNNIKSKLINSSFLVIPSREEGMPMIILEAMECGLPIIGFNNSGTSFLVKHNKNGLLCETGNIQKLSENISELIENEAKKLRLAKNSKDLISNFHIDKIEKNWKKILE